MKFFVRCFGGVAFAGCLLGANLGWSQELEWVRQAGGTNDDGGLAVATDLEGNIYTVMSGWGSVNVAGNSYTYLNQWYALLIKYHPDGGCEWVRTFGSGTYFQVGGLAVDPHGYVYLAGSFGGRTSSGPVRQSDTSSGELTASDYDAFLLKYDLSGNLLWARKYGGANTQYCDSLALDSYGNIYLCGTFRNTADLGGIHLEGSGLGHVWLARLDSEGQVIWAKAAHTGYYAVGPYIIAPDPTNGTVYLTGAFSWSMDFGPLQFEARNVWDMFLAKYGPSGDFLWGRQGGGPALDLAVDADGCVAITGYLHQVAYPSGYADTFEGVVVSGSNPFYLVKYDAAGRLVWAINDGGNQLALDSAGSIYATGDILNTSLIGDTWLTATGFIDIYVTKRDRVGRLLWVKQFGDLEQDLNGDVAVDGAGNVILVGKAYHTSSASNYPLTNYGSYDAITVRFANNNSAIAAQPQDQILPGGSDATFSVQLSDTSSASFQWLKNGAPLTDAGRITGSTTDTLRISSISLDDEGEYSVRVNTDHGSILSNLARLRLTGLMRFVSSVKADWGPFLATFTGPSGRLYNVEYSTNLVNWMFLTNGVAFDGVMSVTDWSVSTNTARFYRAVSH